MSDAPEDDVTEENFLAILEEASGQTTGLLHTDDPNDTRDAPVADPNPDDVDDDDFLTEEDADAVDDLS